MRILVVAYLFPPAGGSGVVRTTKLARHLPAHGVVPDILTSHDVAPWPDRERLREVPAGTVVRRCPGLLPWQWPGRSDATGRPGAPRRGRAPASFRAWLRGWLSIPDRAGYWIPFAVREGIRMGAAETYDAIYAMGGPWSNALVGRRLASALGRPLVVDFKEPWGVGPPLGWPNPLRRALETRWERGVVRRAGLLLCGSEAIRDDLRRRIPEVPGERLVLVPNGYEPEDYRGPRPDRPEGPLGIVHTGYLSRAFDVRPVLEGLRRAAAEGVECRLRFVGEEEIGIERVASEVGLADRVEVAGPVPGPAAAAEQMAAGALLLLSSRGPLPGGAMPSKIYEYLGAERPILAIGDPEGPASRLLASVGLPRATAPDRPGEIAERIAAIARGEEAGATERAAAPYRWPALVGRIASALRTLVGRAGPDSSSKSLDPSGGRA